jgi:hypothetical protein
MSVRPSACNNSAPTGWIFMKFEISVTLENLLKNSKFHGNVTRITVTLHEDLCTFIIISHWILLRMRNVSDESCRDNENTHFVFKKIFFSENRAVYEIMWKNMVQPDSPQMAVQYGECVLHAGYLGLQTHRLYNPYCFSTTTKVTRTLLNVTLYLNCLSSFPVLSLYIYSTHNII